MLDDNELLFDELYEKTKDCGRVQFINLLMEKERENQELKEQLDYLRSGEYLNQLRFERDMLQHVVDNSKVSKVDKEFIDMAHRNTELLEENQELKKQYCERTDCSGRIKDSKQYDSLVQRVDNQQKEFIEWLEQNIENEEYCYLAQNPGERCRKDVFEEALSKYKEIIGVKDE